MPNVVERIRELALGEEPIVIVEGDATDDVAKLIAGGFSLLTTVLTFFGVKEGVLDRMLRDEPRSVLICMCLVGLAVGLSLAATTVSNERTGRLGGFMLFGVIPLIPLALTAIPNFQPGEATDAAAASLALVALGGIAATTVGWRLQVTLPAGLLVVAAASLVFGLYGAAKIAVLSKSLPEHPQATATVDRSGDTPVVNVEVGANKLEGHLLQVTVTASTLDSPLGLAVLYPDATGALEEQMSVAVTDPDVDQIAVLVQDCELDPDRWYRNLDPPRGHLACDGVDAQEVVVLQIAEPAPEPVVTASIATDLAATRPTATVTAAASHLDDGRFVAFELVETSGDVQTVRATFTLGANTDGTATLDTTHIIDGADRTVLSVRAAICDETRCDEPREMASYRVAPKPPKEQQ